MACYFISYNKADRSWAEWLAWQLEECGHTAIIQAWDFVPGSNFALKMDEAAAKADKIIAVLSPNYLEAMYTQPEWAAAFSDDPTGKESKLIPVRVQECNPAGLLKQIIYIDLVGLDEENAKREFLSKIDTRRMRPKVAPAFPGSGDTVSRTADERHQGRETAVFPSTHKGASQRIPKIIPLTDLDRSRFINESFEKMVLLLEQYLVELKSNNPGIEFNVERVDTRKVLVSIYLHGTLKYRLKAWLSNDFGTIDSIKLSYGRSVSDGDTGYNEQILVEENKDGLFLKPLMNLAFLGGNLQTVDEIVTALMNNLTEYFR